MHPYVRTQTGASIPISFIVVSDYSTEMVEREEKKKKKEEI